MNKVKHAWITAFTKDNNLKGGPLAASKYGWITKHMSVCRFDSLLEAAADAMMECDASEAPLVAPVVERTLTVSDFVSLENVQEELDVCRELGWTVTAMRLFDLVYAHGIDEIEGYEHPYSKEGEAAFAKLGPSPTAEQIHAWLSEWVPETVIEEIDPSKAVPVTLIEWREGEWVLRSPDADPGDVAPAWLYWDDEEGRWEWTALGKTSALDYKERRPFIAMQQAEAVLRAALDRA